MYFQKNDVNEYRAARQRWLDAIDAKREHYVVSRMWEALCNIAHRVHVIPGVRV